MNKNLMLIEELSKKIGKENVGISASGYGIDENLSAFLENCVSDVEMTMDAIPGREYPYRQKGYHIGAGKAVANLKKNHIKVGIQTVLTRYHMEHFDIIEELYLWLKQNQVDEWSLIRYFPSGRGEKFPELELTEDENLVLVNRIKEMVKDDFVKLDIHYLLPGTSKESNCRCVKKSIGILPDGSVTACFWGLNANGDIKNSKFYLGNLLENKLSEILECGNAKYWMSYCGKCPL